MNTTENISIEQIAAQIIYNIMFNNTLGGNAE